ncbi:MAG: hypothetical protein IPM92_09800 [Saprospiraceae bacterium]|nr:hypothetical protein [Saprospiraceae bacterium]
MAENREARTPAANPSLKLRSIFCTIIHMDGMVTNPVITSNLFKGLLLNKLSKKR